MNVTTKTTQLRIVPGVPAPRCAWCNKEREEDTDEGVRLATAEEITTAHDIAGRAAVSALENEDYVIQTSLHHARSYAYRDEHRQWVHPTRTPSGWYTPYWHGSFCSVEHGLLYAERALAAAAPPEPVPTKEVP